MKKSVKRTSLGKGHDFAISLEQEYVLSSQ